MTQSISFKAVAICHIASLWGELHLPAYPLTCLRGGGLAFYLTNFQGLEAEDSGAAGAWITFEKH